MKYKLCLIIISILLAVWICGCSIPLRITTYISPQELSRQEAIRQEELSKEKYQRMISRHARRLSKKVAQKKKLKEEQKKLKEEAMQERNQILRLFNKEQGRILVACEKTGLETFLVAKWINAYGGKDLDEFLDYIYDNAAPYQVITRWALEEGFQGQAGPFAEIRAAYNLLLEIERNK